MAIKQRLGRAKVRSHPECIFFADEACQIVLYAIHERVDGDGSATNPPITIKVNPEGETTFEIPYGDDDTAILPFNRGFPVFLEENEGLWAVSPGESELTWTVMPVGLEVLGY
jgi:hypothetical protein